MVPPQRPVGLLAGEEIHAGLICLVDPAMTLDVQEELFREALDLIAKDGHLINQVLEVSIDGEDLRHWRYALPTEGPD